MSTVSRMTCFITSGGLEEAHEVMIIKTGRRKKREFLTMENLIVN